MSFRTVVTSRPQTPQVLTESLPGRGATAARNPSSSAALSAAMEDQAEISLGTQTETQRETRAQASRRRKKERKQRKLAQRNEETSFNPFNPLPTLAGLRRTPGPHSYLCTYGLAPFFLTPCARTRIHESPSASDSEDWETFRSWSQAWQDELRATTHEQYLSIEVGQAEIMRKINAKQARR